MGDTVEVSCVGDLGHPQEAHRERQPGVPEARLRGCLRSHRPDEHGPRHHGHRRRHRGRRHHRGIAEVRPDTLHRRRRGEHPHRGQQQAGQRRGAVGLEYGRSAARRPQLDAGLLRRERLLADDVPAVADARRLPHRHHRRRHRHAPLLQGSQPPGQRHHRHAQGPGPARRRLRGGILVKPGHGAGRLRARAGTDRTDVRLVLRRDGSLGTNLRDIEVGDDGQFMANLIYATNSGSLTYTWNDSANQLEIRRADRTEAVRRGDGPGDAGDHGRRLRRRRATRSPTSAPSSRGRRRTTTRPRTRGKSTAFSTATSPWATSSPPTW